MHPQAFRETLLLAGIHLSPGGGISADYQGRSSQLCRNGILRHGVLIMKKFIFVAYDITIDKIRRRLVKYLENYGHRIQYSVFCLRVTERELFELRQNIEKLTAPDQNKSVIFIPGENAHIEEVIPQNLDIIGDIKSYRTESCVV